MQADTLTWFAYYDFTCVYVANVQTLLKLLLVFVNSNVKKNAFSQSPQYICVHQHGDRDTDVSGKSTEIYRECHECSNGCHEWMFKNVM